MQNGQDEIDRLRKELRKFHYAFRLGEFKTGLRKLDNVQSLHWEIHVRKLISALYYLLGERENKENQETLIADLRLMLKYAKEHDGRILNAAQIILGDGKDWFERRKKRK